MVDRSITLAVPPFADMAHDLVKTGFSLARNDTSPKIESTQSARRRRIIGGSKTVKIERSVRDHGSKEIWSNGVLVLLLTKDENLQVRKEIHGQIKAFNDSISEPHRMARKAGVRPLHVILRDQDGRLLGGLIADTYWGWLDIDDFWLDKTVRGQGLGRIMLQTAEKEAQSRGCRYAKLETFNFQARGFYEKCGYRIVGQLDDYPPGGSFFWMCKDL